MSISKEMQINSKDIIIRRLYLKDAKILSDMLIALPKRYCEFFIPFSFDLDTITNILNNVVEDCYWGFFSENKLMGLFMLRGFDQGYQIPSYGVIIDKNFTNKGLASLSLQYCISWCQLSGIKKMMLKVHPDNKDAKYIYEKLEFVQDGIDPKNNNFIYYKDLS